MARNPDRIDGIIETLRAAWKMNPDWRLGQLVYNAAGSDPFYTEDDTMQDRLLQIIGSAGCQHPGIMRGMICSTCGVAV